jgi:predicted RNase H-like HicB family nuclease
MNPDQLRLRCYAEEQGPCLWVAVCIDLCLAAQGETYKEARRKLDSQIDRYVEEAFTIDRAYFDQLIPRKAPLRQRIKYHLIHLRLAGMLFRHKMREFIRGMPLVPASRHS